MLGLKVHCSIVLAYLITWSEKLPDWQISVVVSRADYSRPGRLPGFLPHRTDSMLFVYRASRGLCMSLRFVMMRYVDARLLFPSPREGQSWWPKAKLTDPCICREELEQ